MKKELNELKKQLKTLSLTVTCALIKLGSIYINYIVSFDPLIKEYSTPSFFQLVCGYFFIRLILSPANKSVKPKTEDEACIERIQTFGIIGIVGLLVYLFT